MWLINKWKENKLPFIMLSVGLLLFAVLFFADSASDNGGQGISSAGGNNAGSSVSNSMGANSMNSMGSNSMGSDPCPDYALQIEEKLEAVLSRTAGVGKVRVVVSLEDYGEIYPFEEENSSSDGSKESDSAGGTRESNSEKGETGASVIKHSDGSESIAVRKSVTPTVKGVVVCAAGAESYAVQERIVKAVKAFCCIGIECIEILPMGE